MTVAMNGHTARRNATHAALHQTALTMFAERSFDDVTVQEIAAAVGVTERTFYRHFPTKEAVLFQDYEHQLDWLAVALARRPATESVFDAVRIAIHSFPHDLEIVRQAASVRSSMISGEQIEAHLRIVQASFAAVLRDFVAARHAEHPDVVVLSAVAGNVLAGALIASLQVWGSQVDIEALDDTVSRCVDYVRDGLAPLH